MSLTSIPYGSNLACKAQAVGLFAKTMQSMTKINQLAGPFPQQSNAENTLRNQTSVDYPIVRCMDLTKNPGDEVWFDLINPIGGKPIMGGQYAEGRGTPMTFGRDKLRINQTRKPINAGDTMTQQRTPHQLRTLARAAGYGYMARLEDQMTLIHAAGSRGFHDNIEWSVPLASDPDFADIVVNPVRAPSNNRHYLASGNYIKPIVASGNEITIATTDVLNMGVVDSIRALLDSMPMPPAPCKFNGDVMADDSPLRVLLVSPQQYSAFATQSTFRTYQANAMQRAAAAKDLDLFRGDVALWNGILIVKMPKPIRFYTGNPVNWCASATSETETTTDLCPASFTAGVYAIDRMILLGAQSVGVALGKARQSGIPYFWSEKELDHGDKVEVLAGMINGRSKIRFNVNFGDTIQPTDNGIITIDTAVHL